MQTTDYGFRDLGGLGFTSIPPKFAEYRILSLFMGLGPLRCLFLGEVRSDLGPFLRATPQEEIGFRGLGFRV